MLNNTALYTQVKFDERELFKLLEMSIALLFLISVLSLVFYFFLPPPQAPTIYR